MARNPFTLSSSRAGHGEVHLVLLPPFSVKFKDLSYTYPLKLVASTPHTISPVPLSENCFGSPQPRPSSVPLLFLLSYGGGLLPPDALSLKIVLDPITRLTITTQGSTKIFPSPSQIVNPKSHNPRLTPFCASQKLEVELGAHSALLLSPDPSQPFRKSNYSQLQIFKVHEGASLGLLDWVSCGRRARGEAWDASSWRGRNEIWSVYSLDSPLNADGRAPMGRRLLLRDTAILSDGPAGFGQSTLKAEKIGVFGTLILFGPVFEEMGCFFVNEFSALPRIGGREWGDTIAPVQSNSAKSKSNQNADVNSSGEAANMQEPEDQNQEESLLQWRLRRQRQEKTNGVVWTAARVRGLVLVKFGADEVGGAREWLADMWKQEATVGREFGPGGLMSVK